jgi:hypothetical protein
MEQVTGLPAEELERHLVILEQQGFLQKEEGPRGIYYRKKEILS